MFAQFHIHHEDDIHTGQPEKRRKSENSSAIASSKRYWNPFSFFSSNPTTSQENPSKQHGSK